MGKIQFKGMPAPAGARYLKTKVASAVLFALHGSMAAQAEESGDPGTAGLQEITVTATRRTETIEAVPYSLSVVSMEQLNQSGVTDVMSLSSTVPGLSTYDTGVRNAAAVSPIMRGINATAQPQRGFRVFEQNPVGTYIGNSPVDGYFQLDDLKQVEVLRGPQGTLYGAGALGGALRLIPNAPDPHAFAAEVEAGGDRVHNSSGTGYDLKGMVNIPITDTFAVRASAKYQYDPGWINAYGILQRSNPGPGGVPILADPSDPIGSSGIVSGQKDWNWDKIFTGRLSALWKPTDDFTATVAVLHSGVQGNGGSTVNMNWPGGASPIDPNETLPAGGRYQEFSQINQPFSRYTNLTSLDLSYDAGFATLSSTSSYTTTTGTTQQDDTYALAGYFDSSALPYYAGTPTNPRFVYDYLFRDRQHTFTEELRLVSDTRKGNMFDYVLGAFYEEQTSQGAWTIYDPGSPEYAALLGQTILAAPGDIVFQQIDTQKFTDKSIFGELTYHFLGRGQVTGGFRYFKQDFEDAQSYVDYTFPVAIPATPHTAPASKVVGKVNPSFQYASNQYVYLLWSQGFRRGGANSVPLTGIFRESPSIATYKPDETNNYEGGLKGRFGNGISYTVDYFYIDWQNPQISSSLPSGNLAVYNARSAVSKGFELESSGPLGLRGLSYAVGFAYVDAKLSSDFSLPANNGESTGTIVDGALHGSNGQQMPGSPRISVNAGLNYTTQVVAGYDLTLAANGVYRSKETMSLSPVLGSATVQQSSSYEIFNVSAMLKHDHLHYGAYVTNLLNRQEILVPPAQAAAGQNFFNLADDALVNPPRVIGLRVGYTF
jgi:iron complex outermembrane receptor protein